MAETTRPADDAAAKLLRIIDEWAQPPADKLGKLPRIVCRDCGDKDNKAKVCSAHRKQRCKDCGQYITTEHIHLDYVGHADITEALCRLDPHWTMEPMALTPEGLPFIASRSNTLELWVRLTVHGQERIGVGTAPARKDDAMKEVWGDALRNAAMRFGLGVRLWSKAPHDDEDDGDRDGPGADGGKRVNAGKGGGKQGQATPPAEAPASSNGGAVSGLSGYAGEIEKAQTADHLNAVWARMRKERPMGGDAIWKHLCERADGIGYEFDTTAGQFLPIPGAADA